MSNTVWLAGVVVVLLVWAVVVALVGALSGRPLDVLCDSRLLAAFLFFLGGWTGVRLSPRTAGPN